MIGTFIFPFLSSTISFTCIHTPAGLTDKAKEGTYVWESDSSELTYSHWAPGGRNDAGHVENCVWGGFVFFRWFDHPCSMSHVDEDIIHADADIRALCQKPL